MSIVYTKRFLAVALNPNSVASAVVPAGKIWIVRQVIAVTGGGGVGNAYVTAPDPILIAAANRNGGTDIQTYNVETRVVLVAGDVLKAVTQANNAWSFTVTGYEFS